MDMNDSCFKVCANCKSCTEHARLNSQHHERWCCDRCIARTLSDSALQREWERKQSHPPKYSCYRLHLVSKPILIFSNQDFFYPNNLCYMNHPDLISKMYVYSLRARNHYSSWTLCCDGVTENDSIVVSCERILLDNESSREISIGESLMDMTALAYFEEYGTP